MSFLVYARTADRHAGPGGVRPAARDGEAEYSYRFLLDAFAHLLARSETVIEIDAPHEADQHHARCAARGEPCTLLAFCPPNLAPVGLACPTVCVFAWEFSTLPDRAHGGDPRQDWRHVFLAHGRTIATSRFAARLVAEAMGAYCEVAAIAAPVFDQWRRPRYRGARALCVHGLVRDTRQTGIGRQRPAWPPREAPVLAPPPVPPLTIPPAYVPAGVRDAHTALAFDGLVFTSIFAPRDGRKNWRDMVTAFVWAFRDTEDATLVVKLIDADPDAFLPQFEDLIHKAGPFRCRVVAIGGWLNDTQMRSLVDCTDVYVNTSHGEGLCLPLLEFMSAGVIAIAPDHTAMADYITPDNAFVVRSAREHNVWPNDPEVMFRTMRYRLEWDSIVDAYEAAAAVLRGPPTRREAMSDAARDAVAALCADAVVDGALRDLLGDAAFVSRTLEPAPIFAEAVR